jgi:WXG100 family type VII secretion target
MDNGLLLVNFGSLQNATSDIQDAVNKLHTQLGELETEGQRLADSWEGSAKAAYYQRQETWRNAARDLTEILQGIKVAVADSADDFQDTERKATNRFQ